MKDISISSISVKAYPENKVCVCDITFTFDPNYDYNLDFDMWTKLGKKFPKFLDKSRSKIIIHAISKCHPNDVFDEIKGKRIAESRAKLKMYNLLCKINSFIEQEYIKKVKQINKLDTKYSLLYVNEWNNYIEQTQ